MKLSIVINLDSRDGFDAEHSEIGGLFSGCKSTDFFTEGILNKRYFFSGFDVEVIAYVDKHKELPEAVKQTLVGICDKVMIRPHTGEMSFNCWNYHRALSMATGDIVCHVDQDTACFTSGKEYVEELIGYLDSYRFVSYPSHWTPNPVHDDSFGGKFWASTRFFICKREDLKLDELAMCISNPDWMYEKYGDSPRRVNWTEHYLAKINGNSVFYPPVELHKGAIFSWASYRAGTLEALNKMPYEAVKQWVLHMGGINYPADVKCE